jgi:hypothetical protein
MVGGGGDLYMFSTDIILLPLLACFWFIIGGICRCGTCGYGEWKTSLILGSDMTQCFIFWNISEF